MMNRISLGLIIGLIGMITPFLIKLLIDKVYPTEDVFLMHVRVAGITFYDSLMMYRKTDDGYVSLKSVLTREKWDGEKIKNILS